MPVIKVQNTSALHKLVEETMPILSKFAGSMGATARRVRFSTEEKEQVALLRDALSSYQGSDKKDILGQPVHGNNLGGYITGLTGYGASKLEKVLSEFDEHLLGRTNPPKTLLDGFSSEKTKEETREAAERGGMAAAEEETRRFMAAKKQEIEREVAERGRMAAAEEETKKSALAEANQKEVASLRRQKREEAGAGRDAALVTAAEMFEEADRQVEEIEKLNTKKKAQEDFYLACANGTVKSRDIENFKDNKEVMLEGFCRAAENGKRIKLASILEKANFSRLEKDQLSAKAFIRCYKTNNFDALTYLKGITKSHSLRDKMTTLAEERSRLGESITPEKIASVEKQFSVFIKAMDIVLNKVELKESTQLFTPKRRRPGKKALGV